MGPREWTILLVLAGSLSAGEIAPEPGFPIRWALPEGFSHAGMPGDGTARMVAISGETPEVFARAYAWPTVAYERSPVDARRRLQKALGPRFVLAGSVNRSEFIEFRLAGWSEARTPRDPPDLVALCRATRRGDLLAAVAVFVPAAGKAASERRARDLLAGCRFEDAPPAHDLYGNRLNWGGSTIAGRPSGASQFAQ